MIFVNNWPFFYLFLLGIIGEENVFYDKLNKEIAFLGYKNEKFKTSRNWDFPKRVIRLCQKLAIFPLFSLGNIGHENVFYDILNRKNVFLGYKNKKLKKLKNLDFSKGVSPWFWSKISQVSCFF